MRVIAGELRGRRLAALPADAHVRPTSDRAREALFSMLGTVTDLRVLDLFCGSGALGIEALSRGASEATLVDIDSRTAGANVDTLGLADRIDLVESDAIAFLGRTGEQFDLIICDAPYEEAVSLAPQLAKALPAHVADGGRLVIESAAKTPMPLDLIGFQLERERRYGASLLRIWRNDR